MTKDRTIDIQAFDITIVPHLRQENRYTGI